MEPTSAPSPWPRNFNSVNAERDVTRFGTGAEGVRLSVPKIIKDFQFWPWWQSQDEKVPDEKMLDEKSEKATEPDVVTEFSDRICVIEAKRADFVDKQRASQLAEEYIKARARFRKPVWLLAVGGLFNGRRATKLKLRGSVLNKLARISGNNLGSDMRFAAIAWHELFRLILNTVGQSSAENRLVSDIREGFLLHGLNAEPSWLADLIERATCEIHPSPAFFMPTLAAMLAHFGSIRTPPAFFLPTLAAMLAISDLFHLLRSSRFRRVGVNHD